MPKYDVLARKAFFTTITIEADTEEEAKAIVW